MSKIKNQEAEFCGKVPLHQTNLIQPHGVLLVVQKDSFSILQGSENAELIFSVPISELVKKTLMEYIPEEECNQLAQLFKGNISGKLPFAFTIGSKRFLSIAEEQSLYYILEIEKEPHEETKETSFINIYQHVKMATSAIEACTTTDETCRVVARELKKLSGFDKVMVYRFDEHWNGDVVAEEKEEGMETYFGLKFPASDIPKQARELYKKSPYRLIPTNTYEPVRLYPVINPLTGAFTDLSNSNLRSVANVHLEYLRNMKVNASMSTRILKEGELWGLIACHHRTPYYASNEMCSLFELLSSVITAKITLVQNQDSFDYKSAKLDLQRQMLKGILAEGAIGAEKEALLQLLDADGIAIVDNRHIETNGETPDQHEIEDLVFWLQANDFQGIYHQPSLPSVFESAEHYAEKASGLLALPIEMDKGDFILAFRSEVVRKIAWGGNPGEAVQFESDGKKYHPRASFATWQQTVQRTALPWKKETIEIAEGLRNFLIEDRLNKKHKR